MRRGTATASAVRAPTRNASSSLLGPAPSAARYREALSAAWRARGRGIADGHTNACRLPSGKLSRVERGALEHARALICSLASIVLTDITCLRVTVPKTSFFAVRTCRRFESLTFHHTDSPTCVFPCPRALYDAMASHEASWWTAAAAACPRGLSSARPDAHRSVFFPYRSPACGVQCNRSSPCFERGAPNFARALTFLPRNTCRFADFASSGLQRPQTTFQRDYWGARTSLICSIPRSTLLRLVTCPLFLRLVFSSLPRRVRPIPRVHQRWLAASADNFPFMLVDVSRATRAREQLYTAIVSSRRRLSCSRPPERSLERTHIAHYSVPRSTRLRLVYVSFSSEVINFLMFVPTQSPAYSPSSPGSPPAHHQAFKNLDSPRFRALLFTFFFHIAYSPTSPACGARRIGRHTTHRFAWRLRLSLRWFERTRRTLRALLCLPAQYL